MSIFGKPILTGVGKGSASGAVASFSDGAKGLPLRSLVANIEPVQDLHGYANPWPAGGGKNILPTPTQETQTVNGITVKTNTDGSITFSGTASSATIINFVFFDLPQGDYILSNVGSDATSSGANSSIRVRDNRHGVTLTNFDLGSSVSGNPFTLTETVNIRFYVAVQNGATVSGTLYPMIRRSGDGDNSYSPYSNICPISGWSAVNVWVNPTYDPAANPTATIQLGQTVYGGTLDVLGGVLTVDRAYWTKNTSTMNNSSAYPGWRGSGLKALGYSGSAVIRDVVMNVGTSFSCNCNENNDILFLSTSIYGKTQEEWTALAIDVQIVVPLATPITIPLTPTQISTLQGQNNLWADSGDVNVEYLKQSLMRIESTIRIRPPHYGCVWDQENAQMSRTGLARTITTNTQNFKHSGSVNPNYDNPFDSIYPWSGRKLCNISLALYQALQPGDNIKDCVTYWETDDGFSYNDPDGVWVYTPEFWGTSYWIGSQRYFEVSSVELAGYHHYEEQITARWRGVSETRTIDGTNKTILLSKPGMPIVNMPFSTIHTYAKNGGMTLDSIYTLDASLLLYLVEYANYNAQNVIGNGVSDLYDQTSTLHPYAAVKAGTTVQFTGLTSAQLADFIVGAIVDFGKASGGAQTAKTYITAVETTSGVTTVTLADAVTITKGTFVSIHGHINYADAGIGSMSGYIGTNGKSDAYYRGEALWGNMFFYTLGAYKSDTEHVWLAEEGTEDNYDTINTSVHMDTGIVLSSTTNYIKKLAWPDSLGTLFACALCTEVGGSSSNPVGDFFYTAIGSSRVLIVGGSASNGLRDGPFCWNWIYTASYSYWSSAGRPRLKSP